MNLKIIFIALSLFTITRVEAADEDLSRRLSVITDQIYRNEIDAAGAGSNCLHLVEHSVLPEDRGRIYRMIVTIYARDVLHIYSKTAQYCEQALKCPQPPLDACQLYSAWAAALEIQYRDQLGSPEQASEARRLIVKPCLEGLAIVLTNNVPEKRQRTPAMGMVSCFGPKTDPRYQELMKVHDEQSKTREIMERNNGLIIYRSAFMDEIVRIYRGHQANLDELKEMATKQFANSNDVDIFIAKVQSKISTPNN